MTGVVAHDDRPLTITLHEKGRQTFAAPPDYIALKVS